MSRLAAVLYAVALLPGLLLPVAVHRLPLLAPAASGALLGPGALVWLVVAWQLCWLLLARESRWGRLACAPGWLVSAAVGFLLLPLPESLPGPGRLGAPEWGLAWLLCFTAAAAACDALAWLGRRQSAPPDVRAFYDRAVRARRIQRDPRQEALIDRLQRLSERFLAYRRSPRGVLNPFGRRTPQGLYVWGPVGRGKSFLMDGFYDALPVGEKARFHFHELMRDLRRELHARTGQRDVVAAVVRDRMPRNGLVYIDEAHLADIDNARLFAALLTALRRQGSVVCVTSNYAPDALVAAIAMDAALRTMLTQVIAALEAIELDNDRDYRALKLTARDLYQDSADVQTPARLAALFELLAEGPATAEPLLLSGRAVEVVRRAEGVAWFSWEALCEGPRSYLDFLELAGACHTVVVAGVPGLDESREDAARRFAWLVEVLYDQRKRLILSAAVPVDALFAGPFSGAARAEEFARVASRLKEMQSTEYDLHLSTAAD